MVIDLSFDRYLAARRAAGRDEDGDLPEVLWRTANMTFKNELLSKLNDLMILGTDKPESDTVAW